MTLTLDLATIALIVAVLWLASLGFYLYTSRQQQELQEDIESLQQRLDRDDGDE